MQLRPFCLLLFPALSCLSASAQVQYNPSGKTEYTDFENDTLQLERVTVTGQGGSRLKASHLTSNTEIIGQQQLVRAACCNLGESFTTNPSVDVNYSDAATGARQIKLLGLSGTYVQMLTENVPNLRGAAIPFGLGYIPGPWMQSIQVSKGASSVRNGYESTTGQINIEYLKPQGVDHLNGNVYYDAKQKFELNLMAGSHILGNLLGDEFGQSPLSTSLLLHFEDCQTDHDANGDGFMDMPKQRQWNGMWRAAYVSPKWISQFFVRGLREERESGMSHKHTVLTGIEHYGIEINTNRYETQWKNALILDPDHSTSLALMLHGSWHDAEHTFGHRQYDVLQKNGYAQLMYETDLNEHHNLSVGLSMNHDYYKELYLQYEPALVSETTIHNGPYSYYSETHSWSKETTSGAYAQYTYKVDDMLSVIAGIRADYTDFYQHWFVTPRFHVKYSPNDVFTLRASAGKGYRTPHVMAENVSLLATGRPFCYIDGIINLGSEESVLPKQEEAWNYGITAGLNLTVVDKPLEINAEYYYTDFKQQLVLDYDDNSVTYQQLGLDSYPITVYNLKGKSFSHTLQVDASYPFFEGFNALVAFRYNDARTTYRTLLDNMGRKDGELMRRPLTSRYKGLVTLTYKTPLEFWQFDVTGQLNGPGVLRDHKTEYPSYFQLQAQVTREFRHFTIYAGGENLTNYIIDNPIINASDPWSSAFDASQVWGPTEGAMVYIGIRWNFERD